MPIQFDYAACAMGLEETPEMVFDADVREVSNDIRSFSDAKLDEDIQRYNSLIQCPTLKVKDNKLRLEVRLQALTGERARREKSKGTPTSTPSKQVLKQNLNVQNSEKRPSTWDLDLGDRSLKERKVEAVPPPAFQSELQIHRFRRDTSRLNRTAEPASKASPVSISQIPGEPKTPSMRKSLRRGSSSKPATDSPDPVVLFSSDDEELGENLKEQVSISRTRTSTRLAEKRRVESHQKIEYPSKDDPDAVEVYYRDLKHLQPMEFLNDTVIHFYIKYIQRPTALEPERLERFHFFNSFFFPKLVEAFEAEKQAEAFSKLRKWTKGIVIFDKSYLFLPINDRLHWSLAIIAFSNPGRRDGALVPHIFHLDSLEHIHPSKQLYKYLRWYLELEHEQMQCATKVAWSDTVTERVDVPRQENEYDCGLFLLYYIQCFVETAPLPCKLTGESNLFGKRWFRPARASSLRHKIREILEQLFQEATFE